jgi:hypothetical protein
MSATHRQAGRDVKRILTFGMLAILAALTFAAPASAEGSFVIGDESAVILSPVTFWGAQWSKGNSLSGGSAPAAFKGFADTLSAPPTCGSWSARPGNSSGPPLGPLPSRIDVIVSSEITKSGPTISGNTVKLAVVETEPGYGPDPGHAGTGTVVEVLPCPVTIPS